MKFRLGSWAVASSLLSVALIGCEPPVDEKKPDTPTTPTPAPAPADTKPAETPKPADATPAVEPPKDAAKPADAAPAPKDESKKEEAPK